MSCSPPEVGLPASPEDPRSYLSRSEERGSFAPLSTAALGRRGRAAAAAAGVAQPRFERRLHVRHRWRGFENPLPVDDTDPLRVGTGTPACRIPRR